MNYPNDTQRDILYDPFVTKLEIHVRENGYKQRIDGSGFYPSGKKLRANFSFSRVKSASETLFQHFFLGFLPCRVKSFHIDCRISITDLTQLSNRKAISKA